MNCPDKETCIIYQKHGDQLCAVLFCKEKCPPRDIAPSGMAKGATRE
jgi:hypothetical protein